MDATIRGKRVHMEVRLNASVCCAMLCYTVLYCAVLLCAQRARWSRASPLLSTWLGLSPSVSVFVFISVSHGTATGYGTA